MVGVLRKTRFLGIMLLLWASLLVGPAYGSDPVSISKQTVALMQTDVSKSNPSYALGCEYCKNLGYGHNGARLGNLSFMAYNPDTEVSVVVYLPLWDLTDGMESFKFCFQAMYDAAYAALETLGHPGKPK